MEYLFSLSQETWLRKYRSLKTFGGPDEHVWQVLRIIPTYGKPVQGRAPILLVF